MRSVIRVIDVENGPDPEGDQPGIVEYGDVDVVAYGQDLLGAPTDWDVRHGHEGFRTFVKPHGPIPPETSAIHNIVDEDVANAPDWYEVVPLIGRLDDPSEEIIAIAAHGASHEQKFIGPDITGDVPWICTYKVALRLWPDFHSHSNGAVRYALKPAGLDRQRAFPTHRSYPDAYVTAFTVREALNLGHSIETLVKWSSEPAMMPRCKIGDWRGPKGYGTPWEEVDDGMLNWILRKDFDEDTKFVVRMHIEKRERERREQKELAELNRQFRQNGMPESDCFGGKGYGIHADGKPANDFTETDKRDREHRRDKSTMELDL
jgi:exodeoxyribonuclease X